MTTNDNLKEAFAGESQAHQKYRAFAKKAEQDGFPNVGRLFRTAAEAETIHAQMYEQMDRRRGRCSWPTRCWAPGRVR